MGWKFPLTFIPNGSVTAAKIGDGAITTPKLADLAVATAKLADAAVATSKIADGSVASTKIANAAITNALIANLAVGTANIQLAGITTALIADLAVTNAKIDDLAADKITAGTITATIELLAATVTGGLMRTAASGQRIEITGSHVDRVAMFSGNVFETAAGRLDVDSNAALTLITPALTGLGAPMVRLLPLTGTVQLWSGDGSVAMFVDDAGASISGGFLSYDDTWHGPVFQNSWANFGVPYQVARYTIDALGYVVVQGLIAGGTIGATTPAFTLPAGYRPVARQVFACESFGVVSRVDVDNAGNVLVIDGDNTFIALQLRFPLS